MPARRSPFRPPPLRGDRTQSGAAERQGAPAAARVDRVLQLVDPSARAQRQLLLLQDAQVGRVRRSLRCRLTSKFKGEPPRTSTAALGTLRLPPPALLLATEGGRRDGGGLMDLGDSEGLDARPVGAFLMPTDGLLLLGLVVRGARASPCASVALPGGDASVSRSVRGPWLDSISSKAPRRRWWRWRWWRRRWRRRRWW